MGMEAIAIQECLKKLKSEFDGSEEMLRDIIINCNVDYVAACDMCKELGLVPKQAVSDHSPAEKSGPSYEMDDTLSEAFLDDDILKLHDLFPDKDIAVLASLYWDNNNNVEKTVNQILREQSKPKRDTPEIESEYLKYKYSFIPSDLIMSAFIRSNKDYDACVQLIETEYKAQIHAHWTKYSLFRQKYRSCSHRYVVNELKKQVKYCKPIQIEEEEICEPPTYVSQETMKITAQREQISQISQNIRVMQNRRTEESRSFGKYLEGTKQQIARERRALDTANEEAGREIFRQHNGNHSLQYLVSNGINIDFHGLQVHEAGIYLDKILEIGRQRHSRTRVTIITGSGHHSKNSVSTILKYIRNRFEKEHISYTCEDAKVVFYC